MGVGVHPMGIQVCLVLNWKFLEILLRFCANLSVIGCMLNGCLLRHSCDMHERLLRIEICQRNVFWDLPLTNSEGFWEWELKIENWELRFVEEMSLRERGMSSRNVFSLLTCSNVFWESRFVKGMSLRHSSHFLNRFLRIENWELRIENWELRIENWGLGFVKGMSFETFLSRILKVFENENWKLRIENWKLRIENWDLSKECLWDIPLPSSTGFWGLRIENCYGVATVSRIDKLTGLFCRISSLL